MYSYTFKYSTYKCTCAMQTCVMIVSMCVVDIKCISLYSIYIQKHFACSVTCCKCILNCDIYKKH